jgi:hypothetical protein
MWDSMSNIHAYVKTCEISIDAATKETYEKLRLGGRWDKIIEGLEHPTNLSIHVGDGRVVSLDGFLREFVGQIELVLHAGQCLTSPRGQGV